MPKESKLQTKLFLLLAGLTISVLFVVLLAVNHISSSTIEEKVLIDFKQLQSFFKSQQALRYDRLVESASLIGENSTFKGNVLTRDSATVAFSVAEFSLFTKSDLFIVTDERGMVLAWNNEPDRFGEDISSKPTIQNAIRGIFPELEPEWPLLWKIEQTLYQVVSVPIYAGTRIIGTLTLGTKMGDIEARELKQQTPLDIILVMDDIIIGSSHENVEAESYKKITTQNVRLIDSLVHNVEISDPLRFTVEGEEQLSFISPLGIGERAFYIATVPLSNEFRALSMIQKNIALIAAITFFAIIPIAVFLGSIISTPIKRLTKAMLKVEKGNLNVQVEPKTNDEIGTLTRTFNKMIIGLRERFALIKYVGDHTLEMIQTNADSEVSLGGSTKKLAILFTDIRGSTSRIEESQPENFISMLNRSLSEQSAIVLKNGGSIDKFIGDSLVALFAGEDALEKAVRTSISIQKNFKADPEVSSFFNGLGIGINYGKMVLGNMGTKQRMDYTVIGSEVNLCYRLCSEAKKGQILLPAKITSMLDNYTFADIGELTLKGFSNRIKVVEIVYD